MGPKTTRRPFRFLIARAALTRTRMPRQKGNLRKTDDHFVVFAGYDAERHFNLTGSSDIEHARKLHKQDVPRQSNLFKSHRFSLALSRREFFLGRAKFMTHHLTR